VRKIGEYVRESTKTSRVAFESINQFDSGSVARQTDRQTDRQIKTDTKHKHDKQSGRDRNTCI